MCQEHPHPILPYAIPPLLPHFPVLPDLPPSLYSPFPISLIFPSLYSLFRHPSSPFSQFRCNGFFLLTLSLLSLPSSFPTPPSLLLLKPLLSPPYPFPAFPISPIFTHFSSSLLKSSSYRFLFRSHHLFVYYSLAYPFRCIYISRPVVDYNCLYTCAESVNPFPSLERLVLAYVTRNRFVFLPVTITATLHYCQYSSAVSCR